MKLTTSLLHVSTSQTWDMTTKKSLNVGSAWLELYSNGCICNLIPNNSFRLVLKHIDQWLNQILNKKVRFNNKMMVKLETYENNAKLRIKMNYTLNIWSFHLQFFYCLLSFQILELTIFFWMCGMATLQLVFSVYNVWYNRT